MHNITVKVILVKYMLYIGFVPTSTFNLSCPKPMSCPALTTHLLLLTLWNTAYHYFNSSTGAFTSTCRHQPSVINWILPRHQSNPAHQSFHFYPTQRPLFCSHSARPSHISFLLSQWLLYLLRLFVPIPSSYSLLWLAAMVFGSLHLPNDSSKHAHPHISPF